MKALLASVAALLLLTAACTSNAEDPAADDGATSQQQDGDADPTPATIPDGDGEGDVDLTIAGQELAGEQWLISCGEVDGALTFIGTAQPLQTVQLTADPSGPVQILTVSGEGFGPYSSDVLGPGTLTAEVSGTGFTLSGAFEQGGDVEGTLTCPA